MLPLALVQSRKRRADRGSTSLMATLGSSSSLTQVATIISPSSTMKKNQQVEVLGMLKKFII